jgi:hypothetical protein
MSGTPAFEKWAKGFSGCDGGNLNGEVWFCGIEWGLGKEHFIWDEMKTDCTSPPQEYKSAEENLSYQLNRKLMKLIAAMKGGSVSEYRNIAYNNPFPFHRKSNYFKLNLFPVACRSTSAEWTEELKVATGFSTKAQCLQWCRYNRFPTMRGWVEEGSPKLLVCYGSSYKDDFKEAFGFTGAKEYRETIEGLNLVWMRKKKTTLAIIPFLNFQKGLLNSDHLVGAFGKFLGTLLKRHDE